MDALGEALQTTVSRWKCKFSAPLPLELYTSSNFIGLFVKEDSAEVLKKFAADFAAEAASKTGKYPWLSAQSWISVSEIKRRGMRDSYGAVNLQRGSNLFWFVVPQVLVNSGWSIVACRPVVRQNILGEVRRTNLGARKQEE